MRLSISGKSLKLLWLSSLISISSCVTVQDARVCSVAGTLTAGAICSQILSPTTSDMNMDQFLDFLEAVPERPDPSNPGKTLPAHGPALCMSSDDWNAMKTELESACRQMGSHCTLAIKTALHLHKSE